MNWIVILQGSQFGIEVKVYGNPVSAVEAGREAMRLCLENSDITRPDTVRASTDLWKHPEPYYARVEDSLTVTVQRKRVIG